MSNQDKLNDYDSEPIVFCSKCYSLKIKYDESIDMEYCAECGCSDLQEATIEEWEKLYEKRYGQKFTTKSNDPKKSPIFKLSLNKLKQKFCDSPFWEVIIHELYHYVPSGLCKADKILWLFDKLSKDNRMDDLRMALLKRWRNKK